MASQLTMNPQMEQIHGEIRDTFRALANGFQKLDKIKGTPIDKVNNWRNSQGKCENVREFDQEINDEEGRNSAEVNKQLNDGKQSMIKELNSYVSLRKTMRW